MNKNKLIILSGPSCVGKTPLINVFKKFYPEQAANLKKIVLYNNRLARQYEKDGIDYHFRKRTEIEDLQKNDKYIVMEVRGDIQAVDTTELFQLLENNDVFYEGNTYIAKILLNHPSFMNMNKISIFLSPFSRDEIIQLKSDLSVTNLQDYVFETMKIKLVLRAKKYKKELTDKILQNIDIRAADAYPELKDAWKFDFVIPNHDGEDSNKWNEPVPVNSDAYLAVREFSLLLNDKKPQVSEKWTKNIFIKK